MSTFKVVVQKPAAGTITYDLADGAYAIEREALDPIGAEIVEVAAKTEEEFIAAAQDADALIARNRRISAAIIKGLTKCKVIGLGSVGADTVDVDAATEAGIVVTNVPDVFIDEVADHTMAMFLAAHRRLRAHAPADRGRPVAGRPAVLQRDPAALRPDDRAHLVRQRGEGGGAPLPRLRPARDLVRSRTWPSSR